MLQGRRELGQHLLCDVLQHRAPEQAPLAIALRAQERLLSNISSGLPAMRVQVQPIEKQGAKRFSTQRCMRASGSMNAHILYTQSQSNYILLLRVQ